MDWQWFALFAFAIFHGIAFGAGLFEQLIVVPRWMGSASLDPEAMRADDTGRRFWAFVTTGPLTILTLINLYFAFTSAPPLRTLWTAACGVTVIERVFTFTFFIPKALELMRSDAASASALQIAARWRSLNWLRLLLSFVAWLLALLAFGMLP